MGPHFCYVFMFKCYEFLSGLAKFAYIFYGLSTIVTNSRWIYRLHKPVGDLYCIICLGFLRTSSFQSNDFVAINYQEVEQTGGHLNLGGLMLLSQKGDTRLQ